MTQSEERQNHSFPSTENKTSSGRT